MPILSVAKHEAATGIIETEVRRTGRPHLWANLALAMVSAAIAAALFLLVLLLIEGWRLSPIEAALVVTVMPLAAILGSRMAERVADARSRAAAGAILVSGGLAGLAFLPKATIALTIPPQILVGIGLALVLSALTETALRRALAAGDPRRLDDLLPPRRGRDRPAGADADLHRRHRPAAPRRDRRRHRGDPRLADQPAAEARPGRRRSATSSKPRRGRCRRSGRPSSRSPTDPGERAEVEQLQGELQDQLDRGATHAFSTSFILAALLGLIALFPIALSRRVDL